MGLSFLKNNMFNQVENDIGVYYYNRYHLLSLLNKVTDSIFVEILMVFIIILLSKDETISQERIFILILRRCH